MKRKGFTLIELLAVIVILAIIALIATPTILGVIEKARKGASEQSALGYIDAVEKQVAINQVKNENLINDGTYNVPMTGITVKGEAPTKGWLKIEKGMVTNYSFVIGKYVITKGSETVKGDESITVPDDNSEKICTLVRGNALDIGSMYECNLNEEVNKIFYVLNVTNDKVRLILEDNYSDDTIPDKILSWCDLSENGSSSQDNSCNHDGLNYAVSHLKDKWNKVNVDLPSAQEIAKAAGITKWSEASSCEDDTECNPLPKWLYQVGSTDSVGYWTSTPHASYSDTAWYVNFTTGFDFYDAIYETENIGFRPVIIVPKASIE